MTVDPKDLWQLLDAIDHHHRAALAKTTELRAHLASLNLPKPAEHRCARCGLNFVGPALLAEHLYITHDGPAPTHWVDAEQKAEV